VGKAQGAALAASHWLRPGVLEARVRALPAEAPACRVRRRGFHRAPPWLGAPGCAAPPNGVRGDVPAGTGPVWRRSRVERIPNRRGVRRAGLHRSLGAARGGACIKPAHEPRRRRPRRKSFAAGATWRWWSPGWAGDTGGARYRPPRAGALRFCPCRSVPAARAPPRAVLDASGDWNLLSGLVAGHAHALGAPNPHCSGRAAKAGASLPKPANLPDGARL
jgi:hypothetical protein